MNNTILLLALFGTSALGAEIEAPAVAYPPCETVIDVTKAPYLAAGNGVTDDTAALQRALNEHTGRHRILYFPDGVYLVSSTLSWPKKWLDKENWGFTTLQGSHPRRAIIRLKDGVFTDSKNPQAIMWCGGFGSADWFHNYVRGLTFDVGNRNPGAIALQFYSNNTGAVRDCRFISQDGQGVCGLDLAHRDMNGPLLVRNILVEGFQNAIQTGRAVNSQTFEHIFISGQKECGIRNQGQSLSIRGLRSVNEVTAVSSYGVVSLLDSKLEGRGAASKVPAIVNFNRGKLFVRDTETGGYARAIADIDSPDYAAALRITGEGREGSRGPKVREYCSDDPTALFPSGGESLRLAVLETPDVPIDPPQGWAVVDSFGADPSRRQDSAKSIQAAIDSGATTVFFPGSYLVRSPVIVRGNVRRILGTGGQIDYFAEASPDFIIGDGVAPAVSIEHFARIGGGIRIDTDRTLVLRSVEVRKIESNRKGDVFLEDLASGGLHFSHQRVFARQLNLENEGTHLSNRAGDLWILGYKTERGGTLLHTLDGGRSELFGNFSYTTTAGRLAPMFLTENASVFAFFHEVCFNGDPFQILIQEKRNLVTKQVRRGEGGVSPYISTR